MRHVMHVLFVSVIAATAPAAAQEAPAPCHPISPTQRVAVEMQDGRSVRGTLLCLTSEDFVLAADGSTITTPLAEVRRIQSRRDPVWDGAVKGAAIPLIVFAVFCNGYCASETVLRSTAAYGLLGLTLDSLQTNTRTIYVGRPRPSIHWRVRF